MRLSKEKKQHLYDAIAHKVMDLRVDLQMGKDVDVDARLFKLVDQIWRQQCAVLDIVG